MYTNVRRSEHVNNTVITIIRQPAVRTTADNKRVAWTSVRNRKALKKPLQGPSSKLMVTVDRLAVVNILNDKHGHFRKKLIIILQSIKALIN